MPIFIKCNASDLIPGDEQICTLRKEKGIELTRGEEAFVWVSENPGRGRGARGNGLTMRGRLTSWERAASSLIRAHVHIDARLSSGLGMDDLGEIHAEAARGLYSRVSRERRRRIWGLLPAERQALLDIFQSG